MRLDKERLAARLEGHKEGIVQTDQIRYNKHVFICFLIDCAIVCGTVTNYNVNNFNTIVRCSFHIIPWTLC